MFTSGLSEIEKCHGHVSFWGRAGKSLQLGEHLVGVLLPCNVRARKMQPFSRRNLSKAMLDAGLDPTLAANLYPADSVCDAIAQSVVRKYLAGELTWLNADAAMNHLYPLMLECPVLPKYSWKVYEAFDAAEYHPSEPHLSEDAITRALLEKLPELGRLP